MSATQHFVYKLIPPRPAFATDQTAEEASVMEQHFQYWNELLGDGVAVVYGPVAEPTGVWGLGVLEVDDPRQVDQIRQGDPAVRSGVASAEVYPMLDTVVRPRR